MQKITYCWNCCRNERFVNGYVRCFRIPLLQLMERGDHFCASAEPRNYIVSLENIQKKLNKGGVK